MSKLPGLAIQKLTVHMHQGAFDVLNITSPRNLSAKCALCQKEHPANYVQRKPYSQRAPKTSQSKL